MSLQLSGDFQARAAAQSGSESKSNLPKILGSGAYGAVYLCPGKDGKPPYAKKISKPGDELFLAYELSLLNRMNEDKGDFVVELVDDKFWTEEHQGSLLYYIKLKPYSGSLVKDVFLSKIVTKPSFREAIIFQLYDAVRWLHKRRIIHLDIKPSNILFAEETERVVLCDFNMSLLYDENGKIISAPPLSLRREESKASIFLQQIFAIEEEVEEVELHVLDPTRWDQRFFVTRWYRPPELAKPFSGGEVLGDFEKAKKIDFWSLGVVVSELSESKTHMLFPSPDDQSHLFYILIEICELVISRNNCEEDVRKARDLKKDLIAKPVDIQGVFESMREITPESWCSGPHASLLHLDPEKRELPEY